MFNVISRFNEPVSNVITSKHILDRFNRTNTYKYLLSTKFLDTFIVDTAHRNGLEIHCINEYGLIYIYNLQSKKLITIISPRPRQVKRYYVALDLKISKRIRELINATFNRNREFGFNEV